MTNRILFWVAAIIPLMLCFLILRIWGGNWFFVSMMIYAVIYRPLLHIYRLKQLKLIDGRDAWKLFIPFYQNRYLKKLWLG